MLAKRNSKVFNHSVDFHIKNKNVLLMFVVNNLIECRMSIYATVLSNFVCHMLSIVQMYKKIK